MGFTGLARWVNAPTSGLELVNENIVRNHGGSLKTKWLLSVKTYRSIANANTGAPSPVRYGMPGDRTMWTVTMNENAFVILDDPSAPTRAESVNPPPHEHLSQLTDTKYTSGGSTQETPGSALADSQPPHYRTTFITMTPPQSLEPLLTQLKARWQPVRHTGGQARGQNNLGIGGAQLTIEGNVFGIGSDWLVRAGNVILAGGTVRGMLLEAEYLPLHVMPGQSADGTSELLSNLLTSLLPRIPDAKTVAVALPEGQWEEFLYSGEDTEIDSEGNNMHDNHNTEEEEEVVDEIHVHGVPPSRRRKEDWQGIDRDRRAAFLIIGALRSEGLL